MRLALTFLIILLSSLQAKEVNMLFIGNSFTFRHNLPTLVKEVFEEGQPGLTLNVERLTYGGQDMYRHHDLYFSETMLRLNSISLEDVQKKSKAIQAFLSTKKLPDNYQSYWKDLGRKASKWPMIKDRLGAALKKQEEIIERIKNNKRIKWDYVVLQSYQDVTHDVDKGYAQYAQKFAEIAKKEGVKVILYITAPHSQNSKPVTKPVEVKRTEMELRTIQKLVDRIKPHAVVPVPLALKNIQAKGTDLTFRYRTDAHPNQSCAFLTANMFYASFYKESTEGFHFDTATETKLKKGGKDPNGGSAKVIFDGPTKKLLQKAAFEAVQSFDAGYGKP